MGIFFNAILAFLLPYFITNHMGKKITKVWLLALIVVGVTILNVLLLLFIQTELVDPSHKNIAFAIGQGFWMSLAGAWVGAWRGRKKMKKNERIEI